MALLMKKYMAAPQQTVDKMMNNKGTGIIRSPWRSFICEAKELFCKLCLHLTTNYQIGLFNEHAYNNVERGVKQKVGDENG